MKKLNLVSSLARYPNEKERFWSDILFYHFYSNSLFLSKIFNGEH
jgi:hypothetical protein